ncbi:MAG: hypothetical protein II655_12470 [Thermoguttaceae bacterium]|nr:hypothetical protein [Thermoguttaceae bacterium]
MALKFRWWDRSVEEINGLIPILTCGDLEKVKTELKKRLGWDRGTINVEGNTLDS